MVLFFAATVFRFFFRTVPEYTYSCNHVIIYVLLRWSFNLNNISSKSACVRRLQNKDITEEMQHVVVVVVWLSVWSVEFLQLEKLVFNFFYLSCRGI